MEYIKKEPIIILLCGKARSGKSTIANRMKEELEGDGSKVVISPYTKYLKMIIENVTDEKIDDDNKPRDLLQKISSDLIKGELGYKDFFINRQIEDLNIYSYFADYIIIPDVRFPREILEVKNNFERVISVLVTRDGDYSDLTLEQRKDITEVALDNYDEYDIRIDNSDIEKLDSNVIKVIDLVKERR